MTIALSRNVPKNDYVLNLGEVLQTSFVKSKFSKVFTRKEQRILLWFQILQGGPVVGLEFLCVNQECPGRLTRTILRV